MLSKKILPLADSRFSQALSAFQQEAEVVDIFSVAIWRYGDVICRTTEGELHGVALIPQHPDTPGTQAIPVPVPVPVRSRTYEPANVPISPLCDDRWRRLP